LTIRKFYENSLNEFKNKLSLETWEEIFNEDDINNMFNAFLNRFLIIYYSTFPKKTINIKTKKTNWITSDIRNLCKLKRELYQISS
jgi:hypothetical protein